ncbi:ABC transporter substrate-binding protein [Burkholderia gladioli pv. gladioli]|uniref:ABC transporter substrate-binding protein n=1 Tax=Burkholderia gladioli TaxID=28095 RepID=A0A095F1E8_BURGA|nr:ABC transporter substrate-binding protein [Burkholderia gladioli]AJW98097.1 receptor ligand binding region family protein [Burkholderia gladioli]ASD79926.1 ABC transporter substrate-binding protein [Burkholderia gladioli pv. gladioli]AWY54832.1 ABC transporter substrate-binding protein [Burkholderia gladioli pv. gladioli]KGC11148.1 receptor ligand binding region family protein [Burkholderia gladioli]MDJ1164169.1 ABC transporter substrate-binding protein [Burkholderia gladioli pv. gladioli]
MGRKLLASRLRSVASIAVFAVTSFVIAATASAQDDDVIKIGVVSPQSGANSRYGAYALKGATLAVNQINAAGGVLGKKLKLVPGDSQCVPAEGVSATQRLIRFDNVSIIIGDVCSSVTLAMQPVVEQAGVLLLNAASSNPEITYKAGVGGYKWTFRNYPTDEARAAAALAYATKRGYTKFAVLSVDTDFGRGAINFTRKYLQQDHATIVSEDYYKEAETDFRPVLSKIRYSGAQAILMYGLADTTPIVARQMHEMGLGGKIKLVGNAEFTTPGTIAAAPDVLNGAIETVAWLPSWSDPRSLKFVADYRKAYDGDTPNVHAYTHWDTVNLLAQAIRNANSTKPTDVRAALAKIRYDSVMGPVTFDDHQQAIVPIVLLEVDGGKAVDKGVLSSRVDYQAR